MVAYLGERKEHILTLLYDMILNWSTEFNYYFYVSGIRRVLLPSIQAAYWNSFTHATCSCAAESCQLWEVTELLYIQNQQIHFFLLYQAYHLLPLSLCTCTLDNKFKDLKLKLIHRQWHENWRKTPPELYSRHHVKSRWINNSLNSSVSGFGF